MTLYRIDGSVILKTAGSLSDVVKEALRQRLDLTDATLEGDLTGVDFTGATLYNGEFRNATLDLCNFTGANLRRVLFLNCKAEMAVFHGADMDNAKLQACAFNGCDLAGAQLSDALLHRGYMTDCNFHRARAQMVTAQGVRFTACNLTDMIFRSSAAKGCRFTGCDFTGSDFGRAINQLNALIECNCPLTGKNLSYHKRQATVKAAKGWIGYFTKLREAHGYSVEYVARATGMTPAAIRGMERGKISNIVLLIGLMRLYNLSLADVFYGARNEGQVAETASEAIAG